MPAAPGPSGNPPHQSITIRGGYTPPSKSRKSSRKSRRSGRK